MIIIAVCMIHHHCHQCPYTLSQARGGAECALEEKWSSTHKWTAQLWEAPHHQQPDVGRHRAVRVRGDSPWKRI